MQHIEHNFSPFLTYLPEDIMQIPLPEILGLLDNHFGDRLYAAFDPDVFVPSPVLNRGTDWIKTANTIGINVRTIQHFWNIIPYALGLPGAQNALHILPIWEPGVVASLYGPSTWDINPAFFSAELAESFPHLDTVEKQLKVVVNLLHLLGKAVGMDVVPHTDRYAEMVLANPGLFEWLQRSGTLIVRHDPGLFRDVQTKILAFLHKSNSLVTEKAIPENETAFFDDYPEELRLQMLFGMPHDYAGRLKRRKILIQLLYDQGLETVPATMGPPYRGIEVDPDPKAKVIDDEGREWLDYRITKPGKFSRVFGPLARYKLYEAKDDNVNWEIDFSRPNHAAWSYVCAHYQRIQAEFGFDFMRGDMSHVQMRSNGVPPEPDEYYDLLGAVKQTVLPEKPYFAYFAESFLAPPGEMAYGDECDHLEASLADSTLGDLQSEPVGTQRFVQLFAQYRQYLETRRFAPNFTLMTADKDDPRFDSYYMEGNEIRYFIALFLTDMPSYMGMGFECRDPHPEPASNEFYSKLYVFHLSDGPKGTCGPYRWGQNKTLYERLARQKVLSEKISPQIRDARVRWLLPPDPTGQGKVIAWTQAESPTYVFVANLDTAHQAEKVQIPLPEDANWALLFQTHREESAASANFKGFLQLTQIGAGEGLVYLMMNDE